MRFQLQRKSTNGDIYRVLENEEDEAEIGLLTGTEIDDIRPYSNKKHITCFSSHLKDERRNGKHQHNEYDDMSSTLSSLLKKKDSSIDYTKMANDDCVGTLDSTDCSVSLLSNPTLTDVQKSGQLKLQGGSDLVTCCVQSIVKMKEKFEDDVALNPFPANKMPTVLMKQSTGSNNGAVGNFSNSILGGRVIGAYITPSPHSQKMRTYLFDDTQKCNYDELREDLRRDKERIHMDQDREQPPINSLMIRERKDMFQEANRQDNKKRSSNYLSKQSDIHSFEKIMDLMGVPSSSSSSSSQPSKSTNNQAEEYASTSFSFEENSPEGQNYQDMTPEEKSKIAANITELNRQFYARRGNLSTLEREKMRRQKIKWWDDERSVVSTFSFCANASRASKTNVSCNPHPLSFYNIIMQNFFCFFDFVKHVYSQSENSNESYSEEEDYEGNDNDSSDPEESNDDKENDDDSTVDLSNGIDGVHYLSSSSGSDS